MPKATRHDPYLLVDLQKRRSIMAEFNQVSSFQVRYAIGCCTTGRNFLFGGEVPPSLLLEPRSLCACTVL